MPNSNPRSLILLDRDGTINAEVDYLSRPEQLRLLPGAVAGLRRLSRAGFPLAIVTNQSGVGRGYFTAERLAEIHRELTRQLSEEGVALAGIFHCPHRPVEKCACRKPEPGLALQAATALDGDLSRSFVIGDKECDIALGRNVGTRTVLVRTGYGEKYDFTCSPRPDTVVANLEEAALWITQEST
jgi:D-glycero-D-manno-heptose 1,7-bisphosphate phosphatase